MLSRSPCLRRATPALLLAGLFASVGGCKAPPNPLAEEQQFQAKLAALFPELTQPITRGSIEALLRRERVAARDLREEELRAELRAALDSADLTRARDLLVEQLGTRELDAAQAFLDGGDARTALARIDECARNQPSSPRLLALRGEARARIGFEEQDETLVRDARADLAQASLALPTARVFTQLSEVCSRLGEPLAAREAAERAVQLGAGLGAEGAAERERARACVDEWRARLAAGALPEDLAEHSVRTRIALEEWLGFSPLDRWAWIQRAQLLEQSELPGPALAACWRSLDWFPDEPELHAVAARLCMSLGGETRLIEEFDNFSARHPSSALAAWYPAQAWSTLGLAKVRAERDGRAELEAAAREFQRFQLLAPEQRDAALPALRQARIARAWSLIFAGEWQAASEYLLEIETADPGVLALVPTGTGSGLQALEWIASRWARRVEDPDSAASLQALEQAGAIYERLHQFVPGQADWANNAGFFLRDLGVALELEGRNACKQGDAARARSLLERARALMERSWVAYQAAATLNAGDARVVNDAGVILTYYLQREPGAAREYFERALRLGSERQAQLQSPEQARDLEELLTAMGDAEQNLGVLHLTLLGDPRTALSHLERCRGMGPDPRPEVVGPGGFLEQCRKALTQGLDTRVTDSERWAAPCKQ